MLLFDHFLGPNNVENMASATETKLTGTLYNGEKKRFTWETYVKIHTEQHSVLNGLKDYGYAGIDDSSKVRHLIKGINTTELDVCRKRVMASPSLRDDFSATVELYSTFIEKIKAENPQLNGRHLQKLKCCFDPPNQEEEVCVKLKGKPFSFHNAPGICWPCGRREQARP
jgi:hypothetical protein